MKRLVGVIVIAFATIAYLILSLHVPISIFANAFYDETLFIKLATQISRGNWLGPFSQFTLMKGPGYPVFLAMSSWSGLPLSASHALFHVAAIAVASLAVARLTGWKALGPLVFALLLFHPVGLSTEMTRVLRDQIYWGQALLVVSALALAYFARSEVRRSAGWCVLSGLVLAWAWSTREEGLWFVPALAVLWVGAAFGEWSSTRSVRRSSLKTLVTAGAFAGLQLALAGANWLSYGTFTIVDFHETNLVAAVNSLQSVQSGENIPHVPVPRASRLAIYDVSPSFSTLRDFLDPVSRGQAPWLHHRCAADPQTCGEITGGRWVWALRDAAASRGHYESPRAASEFFAAIAAEVQRGCASGRLQCRGGGGIYLSPMSVEQWRSLPGGILRSFRVVLLLKPPSLRSWRSSGSEIDVQTFWAFLNYPKIAPVERPGERQVVQGWFYRQGAAWPTFEILDESGAPAPFTLNRLRSADIVQLFADEKALYQRFSVTTGCLIGCALVVRSGDHIARYDLGAHHAGLVPDEDSSTKLYIEAEEVQTDAASSQADSFVRLRRFLLDAYRFLVPGLVLGGWMAFVAAFLKGLGRRTLEPMLVVATSIWALVGTRVGLVALVDASAFPAIGVQYLAPACYLAVLGSFFSFSAFARARTASSPSLESVRERTDPAF